jgi:hypothetical protein
MPRVLVLENANIIAKGRLNRRTVAYYDHGAESEHIYQSLVYTL